MKFSADVVVAVVVVVVVVVVVGLVVVCCWLLSLFDFFVCVGGKRFTTHVFERLRPHCESQWQNWGPRGIASVAEVVGQLVVDGVLLELA